MKTEPTIQELREAAKNHPNTFLAGALYVVDLYASQPMSAEQVHGLAEKYASGYYEKDDYEYNSLTDLCIWEKLVRAFKAGAALSTAPTVKAEGWVSVEDGLPSIGEIDEGTQIMTYPHYCNCNYGKFINARTGNEEIGFYSYDGEFGGDTKLHGATHWRNRQPLPSPPTVNINK